MQAKQRFGSVQYHSGRGEGGLIVHLEFAFVHPALYRAFNGSFAQEVSKLVFPAHKRLVVARERAVSHIVNLFRRGEIVRVPGKHHRPAEQYLRALAVPRLGKPRGNALRYLLRGILVLAGKHRNEGVRRGAVDVIPLYVVLQFVEDHRRDDLGIVGAGHAANGVGVFYFKADNAERVFVGDNVVQIDFKRLAVVNAHVRIHVFAVVFQRKQQPQVSQRFRKQLYAQLNKEHLQHDAQNHHRKEIRHVEAALERDRTPGGEEVHNKEQYVERRNDVKQRNAPAALVIQRFAGVNKALAVDRVGYHQQLHQQGGDSEQIALQFGETAYLAGYAKYIVAQQREQRGVKQEIKCL